MWILFLCYSIYIFFVISVWGCWLFQSASGVHAKFQSLYCRSRVYIVSSLYCVFCRSSMRIPFKFSKSYGKIRWLHLDLNFGCTYWNAGHATKVLIGITATGRRFITDHSIYIENPLAIITLPSQSNFTHNSSRH